jgi:hypothetical protein
LLQVEALTNTLAQMQATNVAFSASLRSAEGEITPEQQQALRCAGALVCCLSALWLPDFVSAADRMHVSCDGLRTLLVDTLFAKGLNTLNSCACMFFGKKTQAPVDHLTNCLPAGTSWMPATTSSRR